MEIVKTKDLLMGEIMALEGQIRRFNKQKDDYVVAADYDNAANCRDQVEECKKQIAALKKEAASCADFDPMALMISTADIPFEVEPSEFMTVLSPDFKQSIFIEIALINRIADVMRHSFDTVYKDMGARLFGWIETEGYKKLPKDNVAAEIHFRGCSVGFHVARFGGRWHAFDPRITEGDPT